MIRAPKLLIKATADVLGGVGALARWWWRYGAYWPCVCEESVGARRNQSCPVGTAHEQFLLISLRKDCVTER